MQEIKPKFEGITIFNNSIEEGCIIENSLNGLGTMVIDNDFLMSMKDIADKIKNDKNLISVLNEIHKQVIEYYSSENKNNHSREDTYFNNVTCNEDGMYIGTKISALKGKNVAQCSEKSIAAYTILNELYSSGEIKREPSLVFSYLSTEDSDMRPHAFVMLNMEEDNEATRHLILDIENPALVENERGETQYSIGLYSLTDEEYNRLISGKDCMPKLTFELFNLCQEVGKKLIYGNTKYSKKL